MLPPAPSLHPCRSGTADFRGAGFLGGAPHALVPIPNTAPPAMASGTPEASPAPSDQGESRDCSSVDRSAHASHGTIKETQPCSMGAQWGRGAHHLLTETHSMLWQALLAHELCAGLVQPSCPGATILPWCLVLTLTAGVSQRGLAAALGHRAVSDHPHLKSFRAGSLPLTQ